MIEDLRKFFQSQAGVAVGVVLGLVGVIAIFMAFKSTFGDTESERFTNARVFIDADTGKTFKYELKIGSKIPAPSPSGKDNGYPAESCYWTKDGKPKKDPTYVLLNSYKGSNDPTFCPDCGRLVVGHNPAPKPGATPPPTKEEYKPRTNASSNR
jgi:hypothetical protein